jgi:hypothetical protein
MRKKILTVLAPVLAIMAFAVIPAMAQATPLVQLNGESAAGHTIQATSSNLTTHLESGNLECTNNDLSVFMQSGSFGDVTGGGFTNAEGGPCAVGGSSNVVDIITNANEGWGVNFNVATDQGALVSAHGIQFTAQYQDEEEVSLKTCRYVATAVPFTYNQQVEPTTLTVEQTEFAREEPSDVGCDATASLDGSFTVANVKIDD